MPMPWQRIFHAEKGRVMYWASLGRIALQHMQGEIIQFTPEEAREFAQRISNLADLIDEEERLIQRRLWYDDWM